MKEPGEEKEKPGEKEIRERPDLFSWVDYIIIGVLLLLFLFVFVFLVLSLLEMLGGAGL